MPYVASIKNPRLKIFISTGLILALILFLIWKSNLDFKQIHLSLTLLDPKLLVLAFGMNLLQVFFWILRPWPLLPKNSRLSFLTLAKAISIGQFLNSFAPARAGDVTKVFLLSSNKIRNPLRPSTAVGLLTTDKIMDLIAIFLLAFISGATKLESKSGSINPAVYFLFLLIPMLLMGIWFLLKPRFKEKVRIWFADFLIGLKPLLTPKAAFFSMLFALSVWVAEALAILFVLKASGIPLQFSDSVYIVCIVNLGILVPVSFANVGAFEAAFVYGVSKFNIEMETGVALAITHHFLQITAMSVWALLLFKVKGPSLTESATSLQ